MIKKFLQKAAAFLVMIGLERRRNVFALMDSDEIKNLADEIGRLPSLTLELQQEIKADFMRRGYYEEMKGPQILNLIRDLFNGGKISEQTKRSRYI